MNLNLGEIDAAAFLSEYWQKKPCLIRQAIPGFSSFISKAELFALSCNDNVESRLVIERDGEYPWQVLHGPFSPEALENLPASHWSLLIQNMECHRDEAAAVLARFNFIPNWRIDDLMISVAPVEGSVGPHLDSYDVFLLQAEGQRRWQINSDDYNENDFIPGLDLRILERFQPRKEWILAPGDMLYLPPGVAHYGVALDDCQTFSIGLRAPSTHELMNHYLEEVISTTSDDYYVDPDIRLQRHPGEITNEALDRISSMMLASLPHTATMQTWFGKYITRLPDQFRFEAPTHTFLPDNFITFFRDVKTLYRHRACKTAYIQNEKKYSLFINGDAYELPMTCADFIYQFTENKFIDFATCKQLETESSLRDLICVLYNRGILYKT